MRLNQLLFSAYVICTGALFLLTQQLNAGDIFREEIPANPPYNLVSTGKFADKLSGTSQTYDVKLPPAANFYDFDGNGSMGFANVIRIQNWDDQSGNGEYLHLYNGISEKFCRRKGFEYLIRKEWYGDAASMLCGLDDLNGDGYLDFGIRKYEDSKGNSYTGFALLSKNDGSYVFYPANLLYNWDANADGRTDLISEVKKNSSESAFYIHRHQPNGDFVKEYMNVTTYADYTSNFDPSAWSQLQESSSIGKPTPPVTGGSFSGAWLDPKSPAVTSKLPVINLDLNRDGYPDLIDPTQGTIYYGTPEGTYILSSVGGSVVSKDLNGDGISDFIIHGGSEGVLKTLIYQGGGEFKETQLMDNLAADDDIYCYDFDQDGDVDILVTFSSHHTDGTAYTMFYENDGKGNFMGHEDQTSRKWLYSNCRDVDNDGYYDLLLLDYSEQDPENATAILKVMLRKGLAGFKFADAEELFRITVDRGAINEDNWDFSLLKSLKVNAEDLDRDGYTEIWISDTSLSNQPELNGTFIYKVTAGTVNSAPSRPDAPHVLYHASSGKLEIDWSTSSDRECSGKDLTYELRIGRKPGSGDRVYAHANTEGLRRNFLDGNAGTNLCKSYDIRTWEPGIYYVAVQAIDPSHQGSVWSEEVSFVHSYIPAEFTVSKKSLSTLDVLNLNYTQTEGYRYTWDTDGATILESSRKGETKMQWHSGGVKTITLGVTATDGSSASYSETVTVLDDRILPSTEKGITSIDARLADYDMDGFMDYADKDGLYHNDGTNHFSKAVGIFNQGLEFGSNKWKWTDWDMDGIADLLYYTDKTAKFGLLRNNLNGSFTKNSALEITVSGYTNPGDMIASEMIDLNNDGLMDFYGGKIFRNKGNGNFELISNPEGGDFNLNLNNPLIDWDKDGLWDYYQIDGTSADWGMTTCSKMDVYHNEGDFRFAKKEIPFERILSNNVLNNPFVLADFDNDGFLDILLFKNDRVLHVLKNDGNKRFTEGYDIELDQNFIFDYNRKTGQLVAPRLFLFDMDNNGYQDLLFKAKNRAKADSLGIAVIYVDEPGIYRQGFISPCGTDGLNRPFVRFSDDGTLYIEGGSQFIEDKEYYWNDHQTKVSNTRPEAPTLVTAAQQDKTLLIQWNAGKDKETPAAQMRYNLSVRKKGETGPGSYLISPLNGGNSTMRAMPCNNFSQWYPCYSYPNATRLEIPIDALPVGELEICVQSIDLWETSSDFSVPVTVQIVEKPLIQAPAIACFESPVTITYKGTQGGSTPIWDFDGGTILAGNGFGPYQIQWDCSGVKKVSVKIGSEVSTVNVCVSENYSAEFKMSSKVFFNTETELVLPDVSPDATFEWQLGGGNPLFKEMELSAVPGMKKGKLRIIRFPEVKQRSLTLTVGQNGCSKTYTYDFMVLPQIEPPVLSLVYAAANKNIITWNPGTLPAECSQVIIYKEGSYLNDFREIGRVDKNVATFTDVSSNNSVKSERYAISMFLSSGMESPKSNIHQTVHLTINRGINDHQWNLIWNAYQGRMISSYRILRGTNTETLHEIATVAGSTNSYMDIAPIESEPYYALELILGEDEYHIDVPASTVASGTTEKVRSNVVYVGDARNINYVSELNILTIENETTLSETQPYLYLYAEVYPVNATLQQVSWSIVTGQDVAAIDNSGKLQGTGKSGSITVQASSIDGSGVTATRTFFSSGFGTQIDLPYNLNVILENQIACLSWNGTSPEYEIAYWVKGTPEYVEHEFVTNTNFTPTRTTSGTIYEWMVRAKNGEVISEPVFGPEFKIDPDFIEGSHSVRFSIYPNPLTDYLTICTENQKIVSGIILSELNGTIIKTWEGYSDKLDLTSVPAGIYLLKLHTDQDVITRKIIKK